MKNGTKKFESTSSWRHYDVIFGMTSRVTPENLENRNFALDFLKIVARCRLTPHFFCFLELFQKKHESMSKLAKNIEKSWKIDIADFWSPPRTGPVLPKYRSPWAKTAEIYLKLNFYH